MSARRLERRTDLVVRRGASGELEAVIDVSIERTIELDTIGRALLGRMEERPVAEADAPALCASVAADLGVAREVVERALRALVLQVVLEGSGAAIRERTRRALAGELELRFVDGFRFECQGSGDCCRSYAFGPLTDADRERLAALDLAGAGLEARDYLEERSGETWLRATPEGRCVFQRGDRCGVHAAFGGPAKPAICQLYPVRALPTIEGVRLHDCGECSTFATSARGGELLEAQAAWIRSLLPPRPRIEHGLVAIDEGVSCDLGHVLAVQRAAVARLAEPQPAGAALLAAMRSVRGALHALATCPLTLDGPERALEAAAPLAAAEPGGAAALLAVVEDLHEAFREGGVSVQPRAYETSFVAVLDVARSLAASVADPERPLCHDHAAVARVAAAGPDFEEPVRLALRSAIFGDQLLLGRELRAGVARLAAKVFLVGVAARLRARAAGSPRVRAVDASFAQSTVARMLRRALAAPIFLRHRAAAWALVEAVGASLQGT